MVDILIASLCIGGILLTLQEGSIFFKARQFLDKYLDRGWGRHLATPLYQCYECMASIHGTWLYFVLDVEINFIVFIFAVAMLNLIIELSLDFINRGLESYNNK